MKVLRRQEASLESGNGFYGGSRCGPQKSKPTSMQSLRLLFQGQQLHLQSGLTSYHRSIEGSAAEAVDCKSAAVRSAPLAGVLGPRLSNLLD